MFSITRWINVLQFRANFSSVSVILSQRKGDNESLAAMLPVETGFPRLLALQASTELINPGLLLV